MRAICLNTGATCLLDDDDFEKYCTRTWHAMPHGSTIYVRTGKWTGRKLRRFLIHRLIMKAPKGVSVDHIDGDGLNNQKSNLRLCTHSQNLGNRKPNKNHSSKFKGVSFHKRAKAWYANIGINGKRSHIGTFPNEKEAALAYNVAAAKHFGEFARLNTIE